MSDLITAVAGGVGVAKTGTALTEKIVAKVTSKVDKVIPENPSITWTAGDGEYSVKPGKDIKDVEYPGGQYGGNSLPYKTREGANKQVISSQADSLIKISRIWA
ncbi:hypothetical protein, partial [Enterobacter roggenkampii]|uniref:hypothetical protein n=1 Tax=Enterobacter roggenkampii TaxID=1812935 RepID=UPI002FF48A5C